MNWFDRAVGFVSPLAGLRRMAARNLYDKLSLRAYDAARTDRRGAGWVTAGTSANSEIGAGLAQTRNRMRDLVRNNPHASRALKSYGANMIGTGIRARLPKSVKTVWDSWTKDCDFEGHFDLFGLEGLIANGEAESGATLIRRVRTREGKVPLRLQVLEADYIDLSKFGPTDGGNMVIAGIEVDRLGRRVAYWLFDSHPGESALVHRSLRSVRVDASEIIHYYHKRRPGQLHGMPRMAASIMRLRDHDDWRDAVIMKKKIEACFAVFVPGGNPSSPLGQATTTEGKREEQLAPGMIQYLPQGADVKFANPSSNVDGEFSVEELHAIAAGGGVTYEQMTGDLTRVSFSSIRAGTNEFRQLIDQERWLHFIPIVCQRIEQWFLEAAFTAGSIRTQNYSAIWTAPRWPYVDPTKDIAAEKEEVRGGLASLSEKIRSRGDDPDEVFAEQASDWEKLKNLNVVVDSNAAVAISGRPADPKDTAAATEDPEDDKAAEKIAENDGA